MRLTREQSCSISNKKLQSLLNSTTMNSTGATKPTLEIGGFASLKQTVRSKDTGLKSSIQKDTPRRKAPKRLLSQMRSMSLASNIVASKPKPTLFSFANKRLTMLLQQRSISEATVGNKLKQSTSAKSIHALIPVTSNSPLKRKVKRSKDEQMDVSIHERDTQINSKMKEVLSRLDMFLDLQTILAENVSKQRMIPIAVPKSIIGTTLQLRKNKSQPYLIPSEQ